MTLHPWASFRRGESLLFNSLILAVLVASAAVYLAVCDTLHPGTPAMALWIRTTAFLATFLLQLMVCARPLGELHPWLGVVERNKAQLVALTLLFATIHATLATLQYHGGGNVHALIGLLDICSAEFIRFFSSASPVRDLPYEPFGALSMIAIAPLAIPFQWFTRRQPRSGISTCFESLLFPAYAAMLVHIELGILQSDSRIFGTVIMTGGLALILALHLSATILRRTSAGEPCSGALAPEDESERPRALVSMPELQAFLGSSRLYLLFACPVYMALCGAAQPDIESGRYDRGQVTELEGVYYAWPAPTLHLLPAWSDAPADALQILLCREGKLGLSSAWNQAEGKRVRVRGHLIYRDTISMLEVTSGERPDIVGEPEERQRRVESGPGDPVSVSGELVAMKCYLGYMWPAEGKIHQSCAIRCLSGGISPGIILGSGSFKTAVLLAGPQNTPIQLDSFLGGKIVQVKGTLHRENGYSYICADSVTRYESSP